MNVSNDLAYIEAFYRTMQRLKYMGGIQYTLDNDENIKLYMSVKTYVRTLTACPQLAMLESISCDDSCESEDPMLSLEYSDSFVKAMLQTEHRTKPLHI